MAVPSYEIYISDLANPSFYFVNNDIKEPSTIQDVDIIGDKLSIDTFSVNVYYRGVDVDGLRTLPFGTPVWYFKNGTLVYKFFINEITRVTKIEFKLECVSAIGLLAKSSHIGGVYTGQTVSDVLEEIIGNIVEYSIDEDVAVTQVFGYLPFKSRRDNLHQLMFAHNISILRDADGDMRFTFLKTEDEPDEIDSDRIYIDGKVGYPAVATEVLVVEHSYQFDESEDEVTLFDNTSSTPVSHKRVIFDKAPIYVPSLRTTDSMVIELAHPNFVVVSGIGTVVGVPYYDNMSSISRINETDGEEYTVKISDATLINVLNSENVANRIMAYYSSAKIVSGDIKIVNEAVGHRYTFLDAFGEQVTAYLRKVTTYASSFVKATSEFISGYESQWFGNNYTNYIEAIEPCDIIVPEGCTKLRFVIIAGGQGGLKGEMSSPPPGLGEEGGQLTIDSSPGEPGKAGQPGLGGSIREVVINNPTAGAYHCSIGMRGTGTNGYDNTGYWYRLNHTESSVTCPDETVYSSGDSQAYRCKSGVMNPYTNDVYGKTGKEGIDGGEGGRGDTGEGEDGEDVVYNGVRYYGGKGAKGYNFFFKHSNVDLKAGGGGGSGGMAYVNGGSAVAPAVTSYLDETASRNAADYEEFVLNESLPNSTYGLVPEEETDRGNGGNAGCGANAEGGTGPGAFCNENYYNASNKLVHRKSDTFGRPSFDGYNYNTWRYGTPGRDGGRGIIIAYSDVPLTIANEEKLPTPELTALSGSSSDAISVLAQNLVEGYRYYIERKILSAGPAGSSTPGDDGGAAYLEFSNNKMLGIWEPRGYFDVPSGDDEYTFTDDGTQSAYPPKKNATYLYRIRTYGDEDHGESERSNEVVVGFGLDYYPVNPIKGAFPIYSGDAAKIYLLTDISKPVTAATAYENFEVRKPENPQWYSLVKSQASRMGALDSVSTASIGKEFDYRLFVSGPDKLSSQFSNVVSAIMPEVSNKLFAPFIYDPAPYVYGGYSYTILWFIYGDSRAETTYFEYRRHDRSWWSSFGFSALAGRTETTKYGTLHNAKLTSSRTTYDFRAYNTAENYETSDSHIIVYEEPETALKWFETADFVVENGSVIFTWSEVDHAASYKILRKLEAEPQSSYVTVYNSSALTFTDTSAVAGETYIYLMFPVAETGYYDGPPGGFLVLIENGNAGGRCEPPVLTSTYIYDPLAFIELNWEAVPHAEGYMLERKKGDGLYDILEASLSPETTSYIDMTTEYLSEYSYRLTALGNNANYGDSELSNAVTVIAMNGDIITLAPPVFELSVADRFAGSVQISWSFVSGAQSYYIERKVSYDAGADWTRIQVSSATRQYVDTGTTYGVTYDYRMKAIGNEINVFSSDYSEITVFEVPDPYAGLIWLNPVSITLAQVTDVNTVTASWGTNSNAIGYKLERKLASDTVWSTIYSGPATSYSDANLTWGAEYDYQITALGDYVTFRDSVPMDDSIEIEQPVAQQLATPVMSGVETTVSGSKAVELTWDLVANASSYKLERKLSTDSEYTVVSDQLSSMAVSYTNVGLIGGRTYQYRLKAIGDGIYYTDSAYSNVVEVEIAWTTHLDVFIDGVGQYPYSVNTTNEQYLNIMGSGTQVPFSGGFVSETNAGVWGQKWNSVISTQLVYYGGFKVNTQIDLTNYSIIQIKAKKPTSAEAHYPNVGSGNGMLYLYARETVGYTTGDAKLLSLTTDYAIYELDVSNFTGNYTIGVESVVTNPSAATEIWIEDLILYG